MHRNILEIKLYTRQYFIEELSKKNHTRNDQNPENINPNLRYASRRHDETKPSFWESNHQKTGMLNASDIKTTS